MQIIPAIDIINGECVRLSQGDYNIKTIYNSNPTEVAIQFQEAGIKRLHLVDLDGAKKGEPVNFKVLESIAKNTSLIIDFGGGIKKENDINAVLNAGAAMVTVGSLAVKEPDTFNQWLSKYGSDKILLGADVKDELITISGWLENTNINLFDFIESKKQLTQFFCTDVSKDGLLQGPSTVLYKRLKLRFPHLTVIASGGVSSLNDLHELKNAGCDAAIVGKAIYENRITLKDLEQFN